MKKILYITLGCIGLALGALGAALPLLPAFPFLMLSAFCFGRSSRRLHRWFTNTKLYKDNLASFVKGEGMRRKAKIRVMLVVTGTMMIGFVIMRRIPVGQLVLALVWLGHILYFAFGVKTRPTGAAPVPDDV